MSQALDAFLQFLRDDAVLNPTVLFGYLNAKCQWAFKIK